MNKVKLEFYIQPNAKKTGITGFFDNMIKIQVSSPPVDNAANKELIKFLSKKLKLKKSQIKIIKGEKNRKKVLEIETSLSKPEIEDLLIKK